MQRDFRITLIILELIGPWEEVMTARSRRSVGWLLVSSLLFVAGCSSDIKPPPKLPDTVIVTGTVTLDGKPAEGVTVRFAPRLDKGYHGAVGRSDASGKYELNTDIGYEKSRPGVIPGDYIIFVSRLVKPDGSLVPADSKEPPMMSGARDTIPLKYLGEKAQLSYTVPAAGGTFDIKLDSK